VKNPQYYCIGPSKISETVSKHISEPMDVENNDTILILQGNEVIEPHQQIINEAPRISQPSSILGPSLKTHNTKSPGVKFDVDLNIPLHDVASVDVYPSHGGASVDVNASLLTTQSDLNIPDPASIYDALDDRGQVNLNLGA
jgi:hypothetical protein